MPATYKIADNGCWEWQGSKHPEPHPYGKMRSAGLQYKAHQHYYELYKGPVPEDCEIHHTCDNPSCVNPDHLVALTKKQHAKTFRHVGKPPK